MSNVDINVDRRTDGRKIGCLYRTLLQAGAIKSVLKKSKLDLVPLTPNNACQLLRKLLLCRISNFCQAVSECNKLCLAVPLHPSTLKVKIVKINNVYLIAAVL